MNALKPPRKGEQNAKYEYVHLWLECEQGHLGETIPTELAWLSEIEETSIYPSGCLRAFPETVKYVISKTKARLPSQVFRSGLYTNPLGQVQTKLPGVFLHCPLSQRRLLSTHSLISGKRTNGNVCKRLSLAVNTVLF